MSQGKILIVDDEQSIRRICSLYLRAEGMEVDTLDGAETISQSAMEHNPDVIVLDLNMPGTDGFAATQILKAEVKTANIPVLILSGRENIEDKEKAMLGCGADDYMTKPFNPKELITRIQVLRKRRLEQLKVQKTIEDLERQVKEMQASLNKNLESRSYLKDTVSELLDSDYIVPLKMITEMVDSMRSEDKLNADRYEEILGRTRQLEVVLGKLTELQKYRKGDIQPHFRYITIGSLLENLMEQYQGKAKEAGLSFEYFTANPDFQVLTDPDRVRRAASLLLDRAIYITESGKIEFDVSVDSREMRITIGDNIPLEGISQEDSHEAEEIPLDDTGIKDIKSRSILLKLPLARNIIEKIHGSMVMSTFGSLGSRISIHLPLKSK